MKDIRVDKVRNGPYRYQATVTYYPWAIFALLGEKPRTRIFVNESLSVHGYESVGWYELPDLNPLYNSGGLAEEIARVVRQDRLVAA